MRKSCVECMLGLRHEVKGVLPFAAKSLYGSVGCDSDGIVHRTSQC